MNKLRNFNVQMRITLLLQVSVKKKNSIGASLAMSMKIEEENKGRKGERSTHIYSSRVDKKPQDSISFLYLNSIFF